MPGTLGGRPGGDSINRAIPPSDSARLRGDTLQAYTDSPAACSRRRKREYYPKGGAILRDNEAGQLKTRMQALSPTWPNSAPTTTI